MCCLRVVVVNGMVSGMYTSIGRLNEMEWMTRPLNTVCTHWSITTRCEEERRERKEGGAV